MWPGFRLRTLSTGDQFRLALSVLLLVTVRASLSALSFSRVRGTLLRLAVAGERFAPGTPNPERIAWAVETADRRLPGARTCLMRSLTTEAMLRLYGHVPRHRIGVDRTAERTLEAHSWIEYEGRILIGHLEELSRFDTLPPLDGGEES